MAGKRWALAAEAWEALCGTGWGDPAPFPARPLPALPPPPTSGAFPVRVRRAVPVRACVPQLRAQWMFPAGRASARTDGRSGWEP